MVIKDRIECEEKYFGRKLSFTSVETIRTDTGRFRGTYLIIFENRCHFSDRRVSLDSGCSFGNQKENN